MGSDSEQEDLGLDAPFPPTDESGEVDVGLIEFNLSLTPAERLERNDQFVEFVTAVRQGGQAYYGENV